jgi:ribonuclease BN (tRNA processing enzyme)
MKKNDGMSRRQFLSASLGAAAAGVLLTRKAIGSNKEEAARPGAGAGGTRLILLGTGGGPRPNKLRNQSAWVIAVNKAYYVVDCGGGVSRQLLMADIPLTGLRHIFITHHHSDHNLEYGALIYNAWVSGFKGRIDSWGPRPLAGITGAFFETNKYDIDIRIPDEGRPPLVPMVTPHEITKEGLVMEDDYVKVTAALVHHPPVVPSYAYRFDTHGRSIVFSGDTTPCDALVRLAEGADVLVHEVINREALSRLMARVPNADRLVGHIVDSHTTREDVGLIAKRAGVKTLVLTHFVPSDDPSITDDMWIDPVRANFSGRIIVSRDLMEV